MKRVENLVEECDNCGMHVELLYKDKLNGGNVCSDCRTNSKANKKSLKSMKDDDE